MALAVDSYEEATALVRDLAEVMDIFKVGSPNSSPASAEGGRSERVMTPPEAMAAGASYIVVGRPVIIAPKPAAAALRIMREMATSK